MCLTRTPLFSGLLQELVPIHVQARGRCGGSRRGKLYHVLRCTRGRPGALGSCASVRREPSWVMKQIIAMGGGGFLMDDNPLLDDFILSRARGRDSRVCFLATASGDSHRMLVSFYTALGPPPAGSAGLRGGSRTPSVGRSRRWTRHWVPTGQLLPALQRRPSPSPHLSAPGERGHVSGLCSRCWCRPALRRRHASRGGDVAPRCGSVPGRGASR
jgi:hypothetical protein